MATKEFISGHNGSVKAMYEELANSLNQSGLTPNPTDNMAKANIELMKVRLGIPEVYINKELLNMLDLPISELTTA